MHRTVFIRFARQITNPWTLGGRWVDLNSNDAEASILLSWRIARRLYPFAGPSLSVAVASWRVQCPRRRVARAWRWWTASPGSSCARSSSPTCTAWCRSAGPSKHSAGGCGSSCFCTPMACAFTRARRAPSTWPFLAGASHSCRPRAPVPVRLLKGVRVSVLCIGYSFICGCR